MHRRAAFVVLAAGLVAVGCNDAGSPTAPRAAAPAADISDGRISGGNKDFFFLPPVLPNPKGLPGYEAGKFNAKLRPSVKICELDGDPSRATGAVCTSVLVANFDASQVKVSTTDEQYAVNWNTDNSVVKVDKFYRLQVFVGSKLLGFVDIDPVSSGRDLKNAFTNEGIQLVDGRTLPIKFRIESGALCTNKSDCGEFTVTNAGGTFTTNTKYAGISFQPNVLPVGVDAITLKIERVVVGSKNECHGAASARLWKEFEGCYDITSDPDLRPFGGFRAPAPLPSGVIPPPALVGVCVELHPSDLIDGEFYDFLQGYKSHNGGELQRLKNARVDFLQCNEGFVGSTAQGGPASNPFVRYAAAGLRQLGSGFSKVFGVRTLNAIDLGLGDELPVGSALSRFDWGIGLERAGTTGSGQSAGFGVQAAQPLEVHLKSLHFHPSDATGDEDPADLAGVPIVFTVTAGDGLLDLNDDAPSAQTKTAYTGANGRASVNFIPGFGGSTNTVTASIPSLDQESALATFNVTGLAPDLEVTSLTRSIAQPTTADPLSWNFVVHNAGQGVALASSARLVVDVDDGAAQGVVATFDVPIPRLNPGASATLSTPVLPAPHDVGDHRASLTLDFGGVVVEASDGNNTGSEDFTIRDFLGRINGLVWAGEGTVTNLPGTTLQLLSPTGGLLNTQTAGEGSFFEFAGLTPGTYSVKAINAAYQTQTLSAVATSGEATSLEFHLQPNAPLLSLTPASPLIVSAVAGGTTVQRNVTINNSGGGTLQGLAVQFTYPIGLQCDTCTPPRMVGVTLNTDVSPAVVTLTADVDETIPTGDYSFVFTVSSTNAANGPISYPFVVRVVPPITPITPPGGGCGPVACVVPPPS